MTIGPTVFCERKHGFFKAKSAHLNWENGTQTNHRQKREPGQHKLGVRDPPVGEEEPRVDDFSADENQKTSVVEVGQQVHEGNW